MTVLWVERTDGCMIYLVEMRCARPHADRILARLRPSRWGWEWQAYTTPPTAGWATTRLSAQQAVWRAWRARR